MRIISRLCPIGPAVDEKCFAIFDVKYQTYLWIMLISLIIGNISYFIYLKLKNRKFEAKKYLIRSLLVSLIIFIVLSILTIYLESRVIY